MINNAVKAIDATGNVTLAITSAEDFVSISIRDNGKGIPPEALSRLRTKGVTFGKVGLQSGIEFA